MNSFSIFKRQSFRSYKNQGRKPPLVLLDVKSRFLRANCSIGELSKSRHYPRIWRIGYKKLCFCSPFLRELPEAFFARRQTKRKSKISLLIFPLVRNHLYNRSERYKWFSVFSKNLSVPFVSRSASIQGPSLVQHHSSISYIQRGSFSKYHSPISYQQSNVNHRMLLLERKSIIHSFNQIAKRFLYPFQFILKKEKMLSKEKKHLFSCTNTLMHSFLCSKEQAVQKNTFSHFESLANKEGISKAQLRMELKKLEESIVSTLEDRIHSFGILDMRLSELQKMIEHKQGAMQSRPINVPYLREKEYLYDRI
jgi:hypothetical protein